MCARCPRACPARQAADARPSRSRARPRAAWNKGLRVAELTKRKISAAQKRRHGEAPALRAGVRSKLKARAACGCDTAGQRDSKTDMHAPSVSASCLLR